jgi:quinol monooxygenase YgiN
LKKFFSGVFSLLFVFLFSASCFAGDNKPITIAAIIKAKQGSKERVKEELINLVELSRQAPGCLKFDMYAGLEKGSLKDDPTMFLFYETWRSADDLKVQNQQADPDLYVRVVEKNKKGIVVCGAKAHQTGAVNSHWILVMPTMQFLLSARRT